MLSGARLQSCSFFLCFLFFSLPTSHAGGKGGRAASKVGLAGIAQYSSSSSSLSSPSDHSSGRESFRQPGEEGGMEKILKNSLFGNGRYDKAIRPVKNNSDVVLVYVDLTYMQVLDLNEKDQTLTSLIRYRLYWKDQFLVWNPKDFNGIENLWLPTSNIWIPDIVCYEETGSRDYTPRLPYLVVRNDGTVRYLEPTEYKTTCHVNISHFPFDEQVCSMTFVSWTFPTSQVDLMAKREERALRADIPKYFADSGEWRLDDITVKKLSQSFLTVLPDTEDSNNFTAEERAIARSQFYEIYPSMPVKEVVPARASNSHWSDVKFSMTFRRNSSLYVQSMLFPAILLTTISLIGFYLPPDSGERIGLQITILLTFMVFILTVGDMFPASTGPFLGLYFVLCMALLGLNIIMTVLVLYIHYIPISSVMSSNPTTGVSTCNIKVLPLWIKAALFMSGVYRDIKDFAITPDGLSNHKPDSHRLRQFLKCVDDKCFHSNDSIAITPCNGTTLTLRGREPDLHKYREINGEVQQKPLSTTNGIGDVYTLTTNSDARKYDSESTGRSNSSKRNGVKRGLAEAAAEELRKLRRNVFTLIKHAEEHSDVTKSKSVESAMEEKWRWVARKVDMTCMGMYVACLFLFHIGIVVAIFLSE